MFCEVELNKTMRDNGEAFLAEKGSWRRFVSRSCEPQRLKAFRAMSFCGMPEGIP
jgi:hypothetical protein